MRIVLLYVFVLYDEGVREKIIIEQDNLNEFRDKNHTAGVASPQKPNPLTKNPAFTTYQSTYAKHTRRIILPGVTNLTVEGIIIVVLPTRSFLQMFITFRLVF